MWWKKTLFVAVCVLGVGLLGAMVAGDVGRAGGFETARLENELDTMEKVNAGIRARNRDLDGSLKALKSNQGLLEQTAREDLGFIRDGEVVVILPK